MRLWLRDGPALDAIGSLPAMVELQVITAEEPLPDGVEEVEFLVPPYGPAGIAEVLPRMASLRVIQTVSAGVDWLLPHVPAGVTVCSARGARDVAVAEWVLAAILAMTKELPHWQRLQDECEWRPQLLEELAGSHVLIVGYGAIGRAVEARLTPFDVSIERLASHRRDGVRGAEELADRIGEADVVVLLVPLTAATECLLDGEMLARMKPGALLVNAARGAVVDAGALVDAVGSGRIRAALDVTEPEPLPAGHPLWTLPGVLLTPHLAGDSMAGERRVYELIGEQLRRYAAGRPLLNVVERGY